MTIGGCSCATCRLRDGHGAIVKWYGTGIDIEDRKRAEEALRKAHADLAHANRVTTMGELCASLAHEINQPISGAITNASTCLRRLDRDPPDLEGAQAGATLIIRDANRAAEIINRVRLFFRKGVVTKERVDINEMIREMEITLHNEAAQHSVFVQTKLAADRPLIVADRIQLQQVLMNLMINGIDAMKAVDGPRQLTLGTKNESNEELVVSVADTGELDCLRTKPARYSTLSSRPRNTAPAWGCASAARLSRLTVAGSGLRTTIRAEQVFTLRWLSRQTPRAWAPAKVATRPPSTWRIAQFGIAAKDLHLLVAGAALPGRRFRECDRRWRQRAF